MKLSEWDTPRTVAAVRKRIAIGCTCDPDIGFILDGPKDTPWLHLTHKAPCLYDWAARHAEKDEQKYRRGETG